MAVLKRDGKSNKKINLREWRKQAGMWATVLLDHVMLEVAGAGRGWRAFDDPFGGCLWVAGESETVQYSGLVLD